MQNLSDIDLSAPGLSFSNLLKLAEPNKLKKLLPAEVIEIMDSLEPGFSSSIKLIELAEKILDPKTTLTNALLRSEVISLMPIKKARELCSKLVYQHHCIDV